MIFGCLGELPIGGWPVTAVPVPVINPGSAYRYLRDAGRLEHWRKRVPTKEEQLAADRLVYLEKARMAILQKKADVVRQDETRMENLKLAQLTRFQIIERQRQTDEQRAASLEKANMAMEQSRKWGTPPPNTFHSVVQDVANEKRQDDIAAQRLESLEKARRAAKEKRERDAALKLQRLENLKKGRNPKKR